MVFFSFLRCALTFCWLVDADDVGGLGAGFSSIGRLSIFTGRGSLCDEVT